MSAVLGKRSHEEASPYRFVRRELAKDWMAELCDDVRNLAFSYLKNEEIARLSCVAKRYNLAAKDMKVVCRYKALSKKGLCLEDVRQFGRLLKDDAAFSEVLKVTKRLDLFSPSWLAYCAITDAELQSLTNRCSTLTDLDIGLAPELTDGGLCHLIKTPNLTALQLASCKKVTGELFKYLQGLPLSRVGIFHCANFSRKALKTLKNFPIQSLSLVRCCELSKISLKYISELPLIELHLTGSNALTDESFARLANLHLKKLEITHCNRLTADCFAHLEKMPLETFLMLCCGRKGGEGIEKLVRLPSLKKLTLGECDEISEVQIALLKINPMNVTLLTCHKLYGGAQVMFQTKLVERPFAS